VVDAPTVVDETAEVEGGNVVDAATVDELVDSVIGCPDDPEHAAVITRQPATRTALARTVPMVGRVPSRPIGRREGFH
jgi:hypothetical protein